MKSINQMKMKLLTLFVASVFFFQLYGFSLGSKIIYLEKLKKEAGQLKDEGFYDKSIELSRKIKELSSEYEELIETAKRWYHLKRLLQVAKQVKAEQFAPEEYSQAVDFLKESELNIVDEDFLTANTNIDEGIRLAELAIEKSKKSFEDGRNKPKAVAKKEVKKEFPKPKIKVVKEDGIYLVKLIPQRRDCLWRIAEYAEIYDDPWKWRLIYKANKDQIKDPNLIYPNQKLVIPAPDVDFDEE